MAIEIGPEHPVSYRAEVAEPFFRAVQAGDSCAIVGSSSMGKSRLLQFLFRQDVQEHYLKGNDISTILVWVDLNRAAAISEWGFYELLLTSLVEACDNHPQLASFSKLLAASAQAVTINSNDLLARRQVERSLNKLCFNKQWRFCFLLDEFDASYQNLPALALANLRAIRDRYKYQVCYALFVRDHPARLRDKSECEGFYELFSRDVIGLRPYKLEDALRIIAQISTRMQQPLVPDVAKYIYQISGGHPGLMVALIRLAKGQNGQIPNWHISEPRLYEECHKLWEGLTKDERTGLIQITQQVHVDEEVRGILHLKGLAGVTVNGDEQLFSPLFMEYIRAQEEMPDQQIRVDGDQQTVWIGKRAIDNLTAREFKLMQFLYANIGKVCERVKILEHLYPEEPYHDPADNRIDNIVRHLRKKIETTKRPRYLLTVRQKGYRLVHHVEEG